MCLHEVNFPWASVPVHLPSSHSPVVATRPLKSEPGLLGADKPWHNGLCQHLRSPGRSRRSARRAKHGRKLPTGLPNRKRRDGLKQLLDGIMPANAGCDATLPNAVLLHLNMPKSINAYTRNTYNSPKASRLTHLAAVQHLRGLSAASLLNCARCAGKDNRATPTEYPLFRIVVGHETIYGATFSTQLTSRKIGVSEISMIFTSRRTVSLTKR